MNRRALGPIASIFVAGLAACGSSTTMQSTCTVGASAMSTKFVANTLTLPTDRTTFAMDLNGDGTNENQLGAIVNTITLAGLMAQDGVNEALTDGSVVLLMEQKADSTTTSECASAEIKVGQKPAMKPKYDGTDVFTVDGSIGGAAFPGKITASVFSSPSTVTTTMPTTLTLQLPLVAGGPPLVLKINGAHLQFTNSANGIMKGQINGAVKSEDVQKDIIPTLATVLNDRVKADPMSAGNMTVLSTFDTGGEPDTTGTCGMTCKGIDGTCGVKGDKVIQACELATHQLIKNVLAPDVQIFQNGAYMPSKDNKMKDSLSLGLGFTAVKASF